MHPLTVWLALSFALWFWHLPAPYAWALQNEGLHTAEHLSFLIISLAFWTIVIEPYGRYRALGLGATLLFIATVGVGNGLLGAVLTFAARPLYWVHAYTTQAYGLPPLEDQQLACVIMWVPASVIHLWTLSVLCAAWLKAAERRATASDTRGPKTVAHCALITPMRLIILIGCNNAPPSESSQFVGGHPQRGLELIQDYGCGTCHTTPGIGGADGNVGPPLAGLGERLYIAGVLRNTQDNLIYWIRYPQRVLPRGAMPNMGVGAQDARDPAAYLYTLH